MDGGDGVVELGGFGICVDCREYRWLDGSDSTRCVACGFQPDRVPEPEPNPPPTAAPPAVAPEPEPRVPDAHVPEPHVPEPHGPELPEAETPAPGRAAKAVRKAVARRYEKGKLGPKPRREELTVLARKLWDGHSPADRELLATDLRALGFVQADPFEALLELCQATVRKTRSKMKKTAAAVSRASAGNPRNPSKAKAGAKN